MTQLRKAIIRVYWDGGSRPEDIEAIPARFRKPRDVPLWTDEYGSLLPLLL